MKKPEQVEELFGLYGAFTLTERVLQQIWLRQDFATDDLLTQSGQALEVLDHGIWNHGGGPDFKGATLRMDGVVFSGDIEVHFNDADWYLHGHEQNPDFNGVILHVVLRKPLHGLQKKVRTKSGKQPETLYMLPKLHYDLETYAEAAALREMEAVNDLEWVNDFMGYPEQERRKALGVAARRRWGQKVLFARKRLETEGWSAACHQYLLEILGYARNRAPMSRIAQRFPLEAWESGKVTAEAAYASEAGKWSRGGQRPANDPRKRLSDYLRLAESRRGWPEDLRVELETWPQALPDLKTMDFRRKMQLRMRQGKIREGHLKGLAGATRCNTAMVDAFLPLAEATGLLDSFAYWWHWPAGDRPDAQGRFLQQAGLCNRREPMCNGLAQGALGLFVRGGLG
jgi:hypothetical protein